ncbi:MAG: glycosyltransferase family 4 protein [Candidatus Heimdallarchaeota archaeon]
MKILLLNSFVNPGSGVSRVAIQIGNGLIDQGHEVIMLTTGGISKEARFAIQKIPESINIEKFRKTDVIYCHYGILEPLSAYLKLKLKRPLVIHDHGTAFPWLFGGNAKIRYSLEFFMRIPSLWLADRIITISRFLERINWIVYRRKSTVIYNGITDNFSFSSVKREKIRKELDLKKRIVVLFVGRWSPHKRIHKLIATISDLRSIEPSLALILIGSATYDRKYATKLLQVVEDHKDTVKYFGSLNDADLCGIYSAADIYATYSSWEGFDLPIFEAMRSGIPIVAFNKGSHREFANIGLSLAQNSEQFKEMLLDLASNPELRKKTALKHIDYARKFSWKKSLDKIEEVLEDVTNM